MDQISTARAALNRIGKSMGQAITNQLEEIKDGCIKEAHNLKEVIEITHEEFLEKVKELNKIFAKSAESENRKLHFFIKRNSDRTFLWKQTVRISCMRVVVSDESETICDETLNELLESAEDQVEVYKTLSLKDFLVAYKMILYHFNCIQGPSTAAAGQTLDKPMSTSMLLDKIIGGDCADKSDAEECIICMERKPEITLPCAHAYCMVCIEQWNVSNNTCPVCRAEMGNNDESWVTPDIPKSSEINAEIQKALTSLTQKSPDE